MRLRNDQDHYGPIAQFLHWATVALLIALFALGWYMTELPIGPEKIELYNLHKSIGVTVLLLAGLRVIWRLITPPPPLPAAMPGWERSVARANHILLYALLFAQPLVGLLHSWSANFTVVVFGAVSLPSLTPPAKGLVEILSTLHWAISYAILVLVALHVLAVVKHQVVDKDRMLSRMLPRRASESR